MKIKKVVKDLYAAIGVLAINLYVFARSLVRPNDWKLFFWNKEKDRKIGEQNIKTFFVPGRKEEV